jgi:serine/threonine protein kinase
LICFSGTVVTDRVHLETLTPTFSLHANLHESETGLQVARAFRAFRLALHDLGDYYDELSARVLGQNRPEARRLIFPYQDHYTTDDGKHVKFDYLERLYTTKLIFAATSSKGDKLFIKFTRRYSEDAHRHCSEKGIAPELYAVEKLPGGWMMVVTEFLGDEAYVPPNSSEVETVVLKENLNAAVDILHQKNFVHGDIRDSNMMVKVDWDTTKDAGNVMLLDFDWAGPVGRTEYPPNVNYKDIKRPKDARDGNLITKEHDLEMIGYIFP